MSEYLALSSHDKIINFASCHFYGDERENARKYVAALIHEDTAKVAEFESWGSNPRALISNYSTAQRLKNFGFPVELNDDGEVIDHVIFQDIEVINLGPENKAMLGNKVEMGKGPNGKWAFATKVSIPDSGMCYGLSTRCKPYDSRTSCLKAALGEVIAFHSSKDLPLSRQIVREAKQKMYELDHGRLEPTSLLALV